MFTKQEFKLEMFIAVFWHYSKWCISTVLTTDPPVDHSVVKVWILALLSKSTSSVVEIFSGLKGQFVHRNL